MFLSEDMFNSINNTLLSEDDMNQAGDQPMEDDANMGMDGEMGGDDAGMGDDSGGMGMDDGMGGDQQGGMGGGMDDGTQQPQIDPDDAMRKRRLFTDYKELLDLTNELINTLSYINTSNFTESEERIIAFLESKLKDNKEKLRIILIEQFPTMEYKQLLTLYIYFKMTVKDFSDLIVHFMKME
jgi:hypothetical protein